jgi:hypothetical protein
MIHDLKIWPVAFDAVWAGVKRHEIRRFDRNFRAGDRVRLREYQPATHAYTGRVAIADITYVSGAGIVGVAGGVVRVLDRAARARRAPGSPADGAAVDGVPIVRHSRWHRCRLHAREAAHVQGRKMRGAGDAPVRLEDARRRRRRAGATPARPATCRCAMRTRAAPGQARTCARGTTTALSSRAWCLALWRFTRCATIVRRVRGCLASLRQNARRDKPHPTCASCDRTIALQAIATFACSQVFEGLRIDDAKTCAARCWATRSRNSRMAHSYTPHPRRFDEFLAECVH